MAWNSASFESILAMIVAVLFTIAGVVNLAGLGAAKRDFARWGYPAWFRLLCGALFTLLRNREPFGHLAPALVFSALVVATVALRG